MLRIFFIMSFCAVIDLALMFALIEIVGFIPLILLSLFTGMAGIGLAKKQGLIVLQRIKEDLANGKAPADRLVDALCLLISSCLMFFPGLLSDIIGGLLLIPGIRRALRKPVKQYVQGFKFTKIQTF